jgi:hypothetical protein
MDLAALDQDLAAGGLLGAGEDLDQAALARAFLPISAWTSPALKPMETSCSAMVPG